MFLFLFIINWGEEDNNKKSSFSSWINSSISISEKENITPSFLWAVLFSYMKCSGEDKRCDGGRGLGGLAEPSVAAERKHSTQASQSGMVAVDCPTRIFLSQGLNTDRLGPGSFVSTEWPYLPGHTLLMKVKLHVLRWLVCKSHSQKTGSVHFRNVISIGSVLRKDPGTIVPEVPGWTLTPCSEGLIVESRLPFYELPHSLLINYLPFILMNRQSQFLLLKTKNSYLVKHVCIIKKHTNTKNTISWMKSMRSLNYMSLLMDVSEHTCLKSAFRKQYMLMYRMAFHWFLKNAKLSERELLS